MRGQEEGGKEKMTAGEEDEEEEGESMGLDLIYSCDTLQSF